MAAREMVLYYRPEKEKQAGSTTKTAKMKGVLVRMGVRIKNITPEDAGQTVGYLAGYDDYPEIPVDRDNPLPEIKEEMLVMKNFTNRRIDELLAGLKRAGVPKIELKAVVTDTNCGWTFHELYDELKKEHEAMANGGNMEDGVKSD